MTWKHLVVVDVTNKSNETKEKVLASKNVKVLSCNLEKYQNFKDFKKFKV